MKNMFRVSLFILVSAITIAVLHGQSIITNDAAGALAVAMSFILVAMIIAAFVKDGGFRP